MPLSDQQIQALLEKEWKGTLGKEAAEEIERRRADGLFPAAIQTVPLSEGVKTPARDVNEESPHIISRLERAALGILGPGYEPIAALARLFNPMTDFRLMQQGGREMMQGKPIQGAANAVTGFLSMFGPGDEAMDLLKLGVMGAMGAKRGLSASGVYGQADELADIIRKKFPDVDVSVSRSRNKVGDSAYVKMNVGKGTASTGGEVRISDHGLGPGRYGDYLAHVSPDKPFDLDEFVGRVGSAVDSVRAKRALIDAAIADIMANPNKVAALQQPKTYQGALNAAKSMRLPEGVPIDDVVSAIWKNPAIKGSP